jgi:hypothetical protein
MILLRKKMGGGASLYIIPHHFTCLWVSEKTENHPYQFHSLSLLD